jgi:hypothetical protein
MEIEDRKFLGPQFFPQEGMAPFEWQSIAKFALYSP